MVTFLTWGKETEREHLSVALCFFKNSFIPGPLGAFCCVSASTCTADFGQARLTSKRQVLETFFSRDSSYRTSKIRQNEYPHLSLFR